MGRGLTLLTFIEISNTEVSENAGLPLQPKTDDLFDEIKRMPSKPAPDRFWSYRAIPTSMDDAMALERTDCYGNPLRMVCVQDLLQLWARPDVTGHVLNRAAWAYLAVLPADTWLVLWWH